MSVLTMNPSLLPLAHTSASHCKALDSPPDSPTPKKNCSRSDLSSETRTTTENEPKHTGQLKFIRARPDSSSSEHSRSTGRPLLVFCCCCFCLLLLFCLFVFFVVVVFFLGGVQKMADLQAGHRGKKKIIE